MSRIVKWPLIVIACLIGLSAALVIWLLVFVNPNDYKPQIQSLAAAQGVTLQLQGDLSWRFFPSIAIKVSNSSAAIPTQGIDQFKFNNLELSLGLFQLLKGHVVFHSIDIDGADIIVRTLEDAGKIATAPAASVAEAARPESEKSAISLAVNAFSLADSTVRIVQPEGEQVFSDINFSVNDVNLANRSFPLSIELTAYTADKTPVAASLSTQLAVELETGKATIASLMDGSNQPLLDTARLHLTDGKFDIRFGREKKFEPLSGNFAAEFDNGKDRLAISDLHVNQANLAIKSQLTVEGLKTEPSFSGVITSNDLLLDKLLKANHIEAAAPLQQLSFSTGIAGDSSQIKLDDLQVNLDKERFTGKLNFGLNAPRSLELTLKGTGWTIPESEEESKATQATGVLTALLAPMAILEGGKGHIDIALDKLNLPEFSVANPHINLFSNGNVIQLAKLSGNVFKGGFLIQGGINLNQKIPALELTSNLTAINLQDALTALGDFSDFSGLLDLDLTLKTRGDSVEELKSNAQGQGAFTVLNPLLRNLDIEKSVCDATALVSGGGTVTRTAETANTTQLNNVTGNLLINGNVIGLRNLSTGTGNLKLAANGDLNLLNETVKVLAIGNIQGEKTSELGCSVNKRLRHVDIPIHCAGPFTGDISCKPDSNFINNLMKKAVVDELTDRLLKKNQSQPQTGDTTQQSDGEKSDTEKAKEALDALKGLFGK